MAKRQRSKFSTITRTTKASGGHIKISSEATEGQPRPYLGYRSGRGMPSAREPWESPSEKARENMDRIFGHGDNLVQNAKVKTECNRKDCGAYSERKASGCVLFPFDISKCEREKNEQRTKKKSSKKGN